MSDAVPAHFVKWLSATLPEAFVLRGIAEPKPDSFLGMAAAFAFGFEQDDEQLLAGTMMMYMELLSALYKGADVEWTDKQRAALEAAGRAAAASLEQAEVDTDEMLAGMRVAARADFEQAGMREGSDAPTSGEHVPAFTLNDQDFYYLLWVQRGRSGGTAAESRRPPTATWTAVLITVLAIVQLAVSTASWLAPATPQSTPTAPTVIVQTYEPGTAQMPTAGPAPLSAEPPSEADVGAP